MGHKRMQCMGGRCRNASCKENPTILYCEGYQQITIKNWAYSLPFQCQCVAHASRVTFSHCGRADTRLIVACTGCEIGYSSGEGQAYAASDGLQLLIEGTSFTNITVYWSYYKLAFESIHCTRPQRLTPRISIYLHRSASPGRQVSSEDVWSWCRFRDPKHTAEGQEPGVCRLWCFPGYRCCLVY